MKAVFMFKASNEFSYLVGYFEQAKGETVEQMLDRVARQQRFAHMRECMEAR